MHPNTNKLTTGSKQPRMAPYTNIFPTRTLTGSAAKWWPNGVREQVSAKHAPTSRSSPMARWTLAGGGASRQPARKSSGRPISHFWAECVNMVDKGQSGDTTMKGVNKGYSRTILTLLWLLFSSCSHNTFIATHTHTHTHTHLHPHPLAHTHTTHTQAHTHTKNKDMYTQKQ